MGLPPTAVVVLTWNGRVHLERLLPTLLASDHPDLRILVADNGSTDDTREWLGRTHPTVGLIANGANLRFAAGNNRGVASALAAGAEVIVLLNDDTVVAPDTLSRLTGPFGDNPRLGIAGPQICYLDRPDTIWFGGGVLSWWTGWVGHRALRARCDAGADPAGGTAWVTGCAMAVRAEAWSALGGLDGSFYIYAEDVDLCVRARAAGWEVGYVPGASVLHAVSATTGGADSAFKAYHKTKSRAQLCRRHARPWHWPTLGLGLAAQELVLALRDLMAGRRRATRGRVQAWLDLWGSRNRYPAPAHPADIQ